jgi:hypothetical protein
MGRSIIGTIRRIAKPLNVLKKPVKRSVKTDRPKLHQGAENARKVVAGVNSGRKAKPGMLEKANRIIREEHKVNTNYQKRYTQKVANRKVAIKNVKKVGVGVAAGATIGVGGATIYSRQQAKKKRLPNGWTPPPD